MEPWHLDDQATIYHGDCLEVLRELPDASVDSVVTDPPYGLEFMGKEWDRPWAVTAEAGVGYEGRDDLRLPSHRDSRNANCQACGGRARGAKRCTCKTPQWDRHPREDMLAFGQWCQEWAAECLRVLKPGGHLLAFGGTRTWHRLAVAIEDAGFEIRDSIAWMYGSGFPKSLDVSKAIDKAAGAERRVVGMKAVTRTFDGSDLVGGKVQAGHVDITAPATPDAARWQGWGTALKPAHEPVVVARKPLTGTVAANVLEHGTGALNIDGCRIAADEGRPLIVSKSEPSTGILGNGLNGSSHGGTTTAGRWPANVVLDEDQAAALDKQSGYQKDGKTVLANRKREYAASSYMITDNREGDRGYGGGGGASRFFYVAKAPARERPKVDGIAHPTVKPLTLMRWLCRLVTPPGGVVLEPFAGSGTTIEAALMEGFRVVAIEREPDYLPLIAARLERVAQEPDDGQQLTFDASA